MVLPSRQRSTEVPIASEIGEVCVDWARWIAEDKNVGGQPAAKRHGGAV